MFKKPCFADFLLLSFLIIILVFNPYYSDGQINTFETGIYLPYINSVINGGIPFKDFIPLRGPFEIYMPAFLMQIFGVHLNILYLYFYAGNVICLIIAALIAKELFRTRFIYYLFIPILITRTFPRVVYTFWGGMRFAFGLLTVLFLIYFFKKRKIIFSLLAGVFSGFAIFTSIDTGLCALLSGFGFFIFLLLFEKNNRKSNIQGIFYFILGFVLIALPYLIYLNFNGVLRLFFDSLYNISFTMTKVIPDFVVEDQPSNFLQIFLGMNPFSKHFKYLSVSYCYIFLFLYFGLKLLKKEICKIDFGAAAVFFYGFALYAAAFRKIGTSSFEMALQPEKILLFYLIELVMLYLIPIKNTFKKNIKFKNFLINFFIFSIFFSTINYAFMRLNKRFFTYRYIRDKILNKSTDYLSPLYNLSSNTLTLNRISGIKTVEWQAQDIEDVNEFIKSRTNKDDPVLMFPELGFYNFVVDRPFIDKFPMATFSWFGKGWHEEFFYELIKTRPKIAVVSKEISDNFKNFYFRVDKNENNFKKVVKFIEQNYTLSKQTPTLNIYQLNKL